MNRLMVSFSGGRTSGYMTWRILQEWRDKYDDIVVLFANTGREHEKTLEFVHNCDKHFGFNTVWLEAVVSQEMGVGTRHRVVTFETASRNGEPFDDFMGKFGIPNVAAPKCTDTLKLDPIRSYIRDELGHKKRDYKQCVGIRVDEMDRMNDAAIAAGMVYPLVRWGVTKQHVLDWWANQDFDLEIPEHLGNCLTCFKKSDRKLMTIAREHPEYFDWNIEMEKKHARSGPMWRLHGKECQGSFRKDRKSADIIAASQEPGFVPWRPGMDVTQMGLFSLDELDISNGCTESCEVDFI